MIVIESRAFRTEVLWRYIRDQERQLQSVRLVLGWYRRYHRPYRGLCGARIVCACVLE